MYCYLIFSISIYQEFLSNLILLIYWDVPVV